MMFGEGRVEEVNSDDDESDGHGVGLSARRQTRFVSDSLQFTGTDLGDRSGGIVRRGHRYQDSEEESSQEESSDSDDSDDDDDDDETEGSNSASSQSIGAREDVLVQSALRRISRAQAQGRTDVKLNKDELAALERRRKRMQEEAERAERERAARASASSGSDRNKKKKHKEQRVAVPLSHFEPVSRKKRSGSSHRPRKESLPSRSAVGDSPDQQVYPQMGYFPPPSGSRSRSSSQLQRPGSRARDANGNSPPVSFNQHASGSSHRHASDSVGRPPSRGMPEDAHSSLDPFQYQTDGPRVVYPAASSSKTGRSEVSYRQASSRSHGTSSPMTRSRHGSARPSLSRVSDSSETSDEDTASDEVGNGAQIQQQQQQQQQQQSSSRGRHREIIVEVEQPPPPAPAKKKSSSPTKRKPAPNGKKKKR